MDKMSSEKIQLSKDDEEILYELSSAHAGLSSSEIIRRAGLKKSNFYQRRGILLDMGLIDVKNGRNFISEKGSLVFEIRSFDTDNVTEGYALTTTEFNINKDSSHQSKIRGSGTFITETSEDGIGAESQKILDEEAAAFANKLKDRFKKFGPLSRAHITLDIEPAGSELPEDR